MPTTVEELLARIESPIDEDQLKTISGRNGRALIILAVGFGWRVHQQHNSYFLASPDNTKLQLPQHGDLSARAFRQRVNSIVRHRGDTVVPPFSLVEMLIVALKLDVDHANVLRKALDLLSQDEKTAITDPTADSIDDRMGERLNPDTGKITVYSDKPFPGFTPTEEPPLLTPTIVKEEPWTAHGRSRPNQGTETYPSDAVMERLWADEHTDYACRWPDCDYVRDNPRSVAAHFTSHVRGQGKAPQPEGDGVDAEWTPKQINRINRLKRELDGALTAAVAVGVDTDNTQWIAEWIITHRIEDLRGGDTGESDDGGPLTAEQILDKIAALADRGRAHILREQIVILNDLLDMSEKARSRVESNLHALRDMINEADS